MGGNVGVVVICYLAKAENLLTGSIFATCGAAPISTGSIFATCGMVRGGKYPPVTLFFPSRLLAADPARGAT